MAEFVPSGDVDPMMPGKGALVCAEIWSTPSTAIASIRAIARKAFIWIDVRRLNGWASFQPFPNTDPGLAGETGVSAGAGTV